MVKIVSSVGPYARLEISAVWFVLPGKASVLSILKAQAHQASPLDAVMLRCVVHCIAQRASRVDHGTLLN